MRTVLIGSDFMYDKNGDLKPIELNTNVGWTDSTVETDEDSIIDLTELSSFIVSNGFTNIVYIGDMYAINEKLKKLCGELNIDYKLYHIGVKSITVPYVEDNDKTLIIRSAYDTTAVVDDTYCRDKVNFLNLIKDSSFGSQFAYKDDSGNLVNHITTINDNGNHPNFILKAKLPQYDKMTYPKLYKVTTEEELQTLISNVVTSEYFLMEYHFNPDKLYKDIITTYRGLNLLVPPNLNSISLGGYTYLAKKDLTHLSTYDPTTFELSYKDRIKYISDTASSLVGPKLIPTDKVQMADGSFKTAKELQVGDLVKTIDVPNPNNVDLVLDYADFGINYDAFVNGSEYTAKAILSKVEINKLISYNTITFTDGTTWEDADNSAYLSVRDNNVRFLHIIAACPADSDLCLVPGDSVILIDASQKTITSVLKTVSSITATKTVFNGYEIGVEENHMFLTVSSDNVTSYVAIEHNVTCTGCSLSCSRCNCAKGQFCTRTANSAPANPGTSGTCRATCSAG